MMTRIAAVIAVWALLVAPSAVNATSDLDKFQARLSKDAPLPGTFDVTPPVLCLCRPPGRPAPLAGQLWQATIPSPGFPEVVEVTVTCRALAFFSNGEFFGSVECTDFFILPK